MRTCSFSSLVNCRFTELRVGLNCKKNDLLFMAIIHITNCIDFSKCLACSLAQNFYSK